MDVMTERAMAVTPEAAQVFCLGKKAQQMMLV
jgi:hypothetical protein